MRTRQSLPTGRIRPSQPVPATYASAFPGSQQPAHFAACVLPSGSIGVFPSTSGDTCKSLGLSVAPAALRPSN